MYNVFILITAIFRFCESRMLVLTTAMRLDLPESPAGSGAEEVEPPDSLEHSIVFVDRGKSPESL